jgi:hypothetical protein
MPLDPLLAFMLVLLFCIGGVAYVFHMAALEHKARLKRAPIRRGTRPGH